MSKDNICYACVGTGKPLSGKSCMCGGTGRMRDAAYYLRECLVDAQMLLDRMYQALDCIARCASCRAVIEREIQHDFKRKY